ncbi:MAG: hypothetical protein BWY73_00400 [candidate division TA06 bacterium ADurb.Bin417]|uniref:SGNH hydrolase-type esterase domain-containing protein n=1 Tax=candidate division TA06 bacterium ADurb.Bin417 TaxID=1852828 RepID=A0A1V5MJL0_UNCT6|nr:MAG: hypothetical protein BWY73_00400 [candidate division TA06 bacterium ADurb.Bin417]
MRSQSIRIVSFLFFALAGWLGLLQADPVSPLNGTADPDGNTVWYDGARLGVEGRGWTETESFYDRLPAKARGTVRDSVWKLSHATAGMCIRFVTDAPTIQVRWIITGLYSLSTMPKTACSGVDLYCREAAGKWTFVGTGEPTGITNTALFSVGASKELMLYLPLYTGVKSVEIGIPKGRTISKPAPRAKPIIFYGTSITQGACASRPGMVYTAIVGRRLDRPVINLGFSANGTGDTELADLMGEIDASIYIVDCAANMKSNGPYAPEKQAPLFVTRLRKLRPATPILLVQGADRFDRPSEGGAWRSVYEQLKKQGMTGLFFLPNKGMYGDDGEATGSDGHPSDLGMMREAAVYIRALPSMLKTTGRSR